MNLDILLRLGGRILPSWFGRFRPDARWKKTLVDVDNTETFPSRYQDIQLPPNEFRRLLEGDWQPPADDEIIASLADHYYDMMQRGIDSPPERLSGDMANNRYAKHTHTLELIAYSRAVGRRSNQVEDS